MATFRSSFWAYAAGASFSLALLSSAADAQIQPEHQAATELWKRNRDRDPELPREPETAVPLTRIQFPDGSGSIRLPEGWKIVTATMGAVNAAGPNDEYVHIGTVIPVYDSKPHRDRVLGTQRTRVQSIVCPYSEDVFAGYTCALKQSRENAHLPAAIVTLIRTQPVAASVDKVRTIDAVVDLDLQDGVGLRTGLLRIAITPKNPMGMWFLMLDALVTPKALAEQERPVLIAVAASYRLDTEWIQRQVRESQVGEPNETGPLRPRVEAPDPDSVVVPAAVTGSPKASVPTANSTKGVDY